MSYVVDVQVNDTKIIALIMNDHGVELFRGEFGYHLRDRERMVAKVIQGTETVLDQIRENERAVEKNHEILV